MRIARDKAQPPRASASHTGFSILAGDTVIDGNLESAADLHVDGKVQGDVTCQRLVQGEDSVVTGTVRAEEATLSGTIEGSIFVRSVTIKASARIVGDVTYTSLAMEPGASIEGQLTPREAAHEVSIEALPGGRVEPLALVAQD
jgi:cytoskeletal protein CcmA (bactofilin family)